MLNSTRKLETNAIATEYNINEDEKKRSNEVQPLFTPLCRCRGMKYSKGLGWFGFSVSFMFLCDNNFLLGMRPAPLLNFSKLTRNLCYAQLSIISR